MELLDLPLETLDFIISLVSFNDWKNLSRTNKLLFECTDRYVVENCVIQTNRSDKNLCGLGELRRKYVNVKIDNIPIITNDSVIPKNVYISVNNGKWASKVLKKDESFQFINDCKSVKNIFLNIQSNEVEEPNVTEFLLRKDISFYIDKLTITFKTLEKVWPKVHQWFSVCPTIRKLHVIVARYSEEEEVGELPTAKLNFEELTLKNIGNRQLITKLVNSSNKLRNLRIENCVLFDLQSLRNLCKFECVNNEVKSIDSILSGQRFLECVIISKVLFTKKFMKILSANKALSHFEVYCCQIEENIHPADFDFVSNLVNLKLFSLPKSQSSFEGTRITDLEEASNEILSDSLEEMIWNHMQKVERLHLQLGTLPNNFQVKTLNRLKHLEAVDIGGNKSIAIDRYLRAANLVYCLNFSTGCQLFPKCKVLNVANPMENLSMLERLLEILNERDIKIVYLKWYSITSQLLELFCKSSIKDITVYLHFPIGYNMIFNYENMLELASTFKEKYNIEVIPTENSFMITKGTALVVMRV